MPHEVRGYIDSSSCNVLLIVVLAIYTIFHEFQFKRETEPLVAGGGGRGTHPAGLYADNPLAGDDSPEALLITVHL